GVVDREDGGSRTGFIAIRSRIYGYGRRSRRRVRRRPGFLRRSRLCFRISVCRFRRPRPVGKIRSLRRRTVRSRVRASGRKEQKGEHRNQHPSFFLHRDSITCIGTFSHAIRRWKSRKSCTGRRPRHGWPDRPNRNEAKSKRLPGRNTKLTFRLPRTGSKEKERVSQPSLFTNSRIRCSTLPS